jgi:hypothetical protein
MGPMTEQALAAYAQDSLKTGGSGGLANHRHKNRLQHKHSADGKRTVAITKMTGWVERVADSAVALDLDDLPDDEED